MQDLKGSTSKEGNGSRKRQSLRKFSLHTLFPILGIVIMVAGVFVTVIGSQQSTENRSRASGTYKTITRVGVNTNQAYSPSLTITVPSGVIEGDVLVAQIVFPAGVVTPGYTSSNLTITPPPHWTLIRRDNLYVSYYDDFTSALYYHIVDEDDLTSYTWKLNVYSYISAGIAAYRNVNVTSPIDAHSGRINKKINSMPVSSITTTTPADQLLYFGGLGKSVSVTAPSGMTKRWGTPASWSTSFMADQALTTSGPTGDRLGSTYNVYNGVIYSNIAQLVALKPALATPTNTPIPPTQMPNATCVPRPACLDNPPYCEIDDLNIDETELCPAPATTCTQPPSGMMGWWPGDGNAKDIKGTNNGIVSGSTYASAKVQQGFSFNGTNNYISLGKGPAILGKGAFSVDSWVKTTDTNGVIIQQREFTPGTQPKDTAPGCTPAGCNGEYILSVGGLPGGGADPNGVPGFTQSLGKICWATFGDGYYGFNFCSNKTVNDGQFHHIVGVREADGTGKIYIDGVLDKSQSSPSRTLASYEVVLGADKRSIDKVLAWGGTADGIYLNGVVDEVEIFNRALSASEVQNLYAADSYGKCKATTPTATTVPTATTALTATAVPSSGSQTAITLDLLLHGIGNSGDNTNPESYDFSNQNPLHPTQLASITIYDANNNLLTSVSGNVVYNSGSGSFKGTIDLGSIVTSGIYTIKVKTERHLYKLIDGIQTLTAGQTVNLPRTDLVAGDVNDDNKLNILDYNTLFNCYSDLAPAIACNSNLKLQTDLNDDGSVNQVDYNLFLREIATQPGN